MQDYVPLGRSGLYVTRLCLGTMTFGIQADERESFAIMDKAFDAGIRFFDTADVYPLGSTLSQTGLTEEIIGRWLPGRRQEVVLATKVFGPTGPTPNDRGLSRRHILDAVDASLRRLNTDYLDLYQAHHFDPKTPLDEVLEAFDTVVRQGKVRYVGVSNWRSWQVAMALERARCRGLAPVVAVQMRYNLLFRMVEEDILPLCRDQGLGLLAYNPLAGGLLTGRHRPDRPEAGLTRFSLPNAGPMYQERYWTAANFAAVDRYLAFCRERDLDPVAAAIAWVMHQDPLVIPILGASKAAQLDSALIAPTVRFTDEDLAILDQLWWSLPRRLELR
ncbi:MAG: aldo/keto reductase [Actinomycetia bacterium]|nr:aldo/keto reductase [Actinomycetes bacterium]